MGEGFGVGVCDGPRLAVGDEIGTEVGVGLGFVVGVELGEGVGESAEDSLVVATVYKLESPQKFKELLAYS